MKNLTRFKPGDPDIGRTVPMSSDEVDRLVEGHLQNARRLKNLAYWIAIVGATTLLGVILYECFENVKLLNSLK